MKVRKRGAVFGLVEHGPLSNGPDGGGGAGADANKGGPTLTHSQCVARSREIDHELARLQEMDTLSREDEDYFNDLVREFEVVDNHRKRLERDAAAAKVRSAASQAHLSNIKPGAVQPGASSSGEFDADAFLEPDSVEDARFKNPWDLRNVRSFGRSREEVNAELRSRARSAIEAMPQATDKIREAATTILENYDDKDSSIARMVLAASSPEYLRAFSKLAQEKGALLTDAEKRAVEQVRAMSLTTTAGGYLVPFQMDPTVIVTANGSTNDVRRIARNVVATGNKWNGVSASAVSWSWDAEASVVSDDSPTFGQPTVDIFAARGFVPISMEALEDEQNVGGTVANLLAEGRDMLEAAAFILGTGTGQPKGIVTALAGTGAVVNSTTTDTFAVGDVYKTQGALPARFRRNASWLANNLTYNMIRQFDTAGGASFWTNLGGGRPEGLLGYPIYEAEDMDGVINATQENYVAVYGDFRNYVIADRIGMTVEFIPHLFQQAVAGAGVGMPTGQRGWFAHYRVGANVVNTGAFKMLDIT